MPIRPLLPVFLFACLPAVSVFSQTNATKPDATHSLVALRQQIERIVQHAQGRVGVAVTLLETGESVDVHGNERFPMQSVYKFPIGMALLNQVDARKLSLEQTVRVDKGEYISARQHSPIRDKYPNGTGLSLQELLRYAVSESDGTASDVLLRVIGGAPVVMQYLRSLGVTGLQVINTEKEIGSDNAVQYRNWAQPREAVKLLRALQEGRRLSKASRALLMHLMTETPTGPRRLKGQLPAGTVVTHKTGSSGTVDGMTAATNDVGLIALPNGQHLAIAVFVSDSPADDATREGVIASIAKVAWEYWR